MADPRVVKGATAPLFDRLVDLSPAAVVELDVFRHMSEEDLKASILREVERIISTKRPVRIEDALRETSLTVLDYGVPDATGLSPYDTFARRRYGRAIELAIKAFEPRLHNPAVRVELRKDGPASLDIAVSGTIRAGRYVEDVWFPIHIDAEAFGRQS